MKINVFSISEDVGFSERVVTVEEVPCTEITKQEGLLRCRTLPLIRDWKYT